MIRSTLILAISLFAGVALAQDGPTNATLNDQLRVNPETTRVLGVLERRASAGDAEAMLFVANAYRAGLGAERDLDRALEAAIDAAELGNDTARSLVAVLVQQTEADTSVATEVLLDGIAAGHRQSMFLLVELDSAAYVRLLQTSLNDRGYSAGLVDGIFGRRTLGAMQRYCSDEGFGPVCVNQERLSRPVLVRLMDAGLFESS